MQSRKVRVRFAPSPTGLLHVGNARTALFNWLFARNAGGEFILRIEDTDVERSEARYEGQLVEDLKWLGLTWDEGANGPGVPESGAFGPYRQSNRLEIYAKYTQQLLDEEKAYRCFCTQEELEAEREQAVRKHLPQVYSGRCRHLPPKAIKKNLDAGKPFAVRLDIGSRPLRFHDIVRGNLVFDPESISDPVIVRSPDGDQPPMPVYNYVVTIDDALMQITHVIRGDDHLSNTPKQVAIYQALGWQVPEFAHLSTILGPDRERLSKRHGATSISSFRHMGYLPEAMVNYLALLGWGAEDGKTETFTLDKLTKAFSLERVTPSPAVFDTDKLNWLNRFYMKRSTPARLTALAWEYFGGLVPNKEDASDEVLMWFVDLVGLFAPKVDHLDQLINQTAFVFGFDPELVRAKGENAEVLAEPTSRPVLAELLRHVRAWGGPITPEVFRNWMEDIKATTGVGGKELFHPVRISITGAPSGPEFDKLLPILETGSTLGIGIPSVRERIERFVGA
ncbi:MAG TPA: glutamate--tRNA ligase [Terracidiphilus sp.]|nr:glutamate--tRNA ligase [Terracidiphilus sp.]